MFALWKYLLSLPPELFSEGKKCIGWTVSFLPCFQPYIRSADLGFSADLQLEMEFHVLLAVSVSLYVRVCGWWEVGEPLGSWWFSGNIFTVRSRPCKVNIVLILADLMKFNNGVLLFFLSFQVSQRRTETGDKMPRAMMDATCNVMDYLLIERRS